MTAIGISQEPDVKAWCATRQHPLMTYNPHLNVTLCRCGTNQQPGEQPVDWQAKREVFHDHPPGDTCRCYLPTYDQATPQGNR